ncbi:short chain dehydrogenase/reductase family [Paraphysoderma sedebokerense]|nr:short chain dehydrogenase/reductase family [Paraphysoderma sedebokerense]
MEIEKLFGVKDKIVLVTGGSRGIGLMIATGFVKNGAKVYISSRTAKVCDAVADKLNSVGPGSCISVPADLQDLEECKRLALEISKREKKLDVLINNAGANWGETFDKYPDAAFQKVMNLNVNRVFTLTQACMPLLEKSGRKEDPARVINIGSVDGICVRIPFLETYAYSASKAALHHLTKVMAFQLAQRNVTVNCVAPGPFESKMMKATLDQFQDSIVAGIPLGRIGKPEDMAGVCLYLSSTAGSYVSGAIIPVDGGALVRAMM